jgi:hypothetical protein
MGERFLLDSEGAGMDEIGMGVVERVFHQPQPCTVPDFVKLWNVAKLAIARLRNVRNRQQWFIQAHSGIAVALFAPKTLDPIGAGDQIMGKLENFSARAVG